MESSNEVNVCDSNPLYTETSSSAEPHAGRFDQRQIPFVQLDNTFMAFPIEHLALGALTTDQALYFADAFVSRGISAHSGTRTSNLSLPQNLRLDNGLSSRFSGHLAPLSVHLSPTEYEVLQQNNFSYILQFNRDQYTVEFAPLTVVFSCRAAPLGERGIVGIDQLLRPGGTMELSDALTAVHLPEDVAAVVTLWILFPGCKKYNSKIRMRRKVNKLPVTVADIASRLARAFKAFLKKEPEWALENAADLSTVVLTKFYRVSKGSWQIELGKRASVRDAPHTSFNF